MSKRLFDRDQRSNRRKPQAWSGVATDFELRTPAASAPQRAQSVEDHGQVDRLLKERASNRWQVAEGSNYHGREAQPHAAEHALAGHMQRPPSRVQGVGHAV